MSPSPPSPANAAPPPTEAASVLLARGPGSAEVFVVRRALELRFFGGFFAFPGGKVHADDDATPVDGSPDPQRVAAARELFEEAGVLLARRADGSFPTASEPLEQRRRDLLAGRLSFREMLYADGLTVHLGDLTPAGHLVTPPFTTVRFDTAFFVADLPPGQEASVWTGELDEGRWTTAADLLACWTRGECLVSPPTLSILEALGHHPVAEAPARLQRLLTDLAAGAIPPISFAPAVRLIPLKTIALPPSTHTNAFLVGTGPVYLIDPGPKDPAEQQRLFEVADRGPKPDAVVLTHHHPDHIGAAVVSARRYGVPVWAHPWTAEKLRDRVAFERLIHDGDRLDLGPAPDGDGPWHLEAIHTPGHAPGHLAFYEPRYRLLFAGDMVSTLTSIVVAPPDGDLAVYLDSLRRLQRYDSRLLLPSHGNASSRPHQVLEEAIAHRVKREGQLLAALQDGPRSVPELVAELYRGLPKELERLAELQTLAGLQKLQREGRVEPLDGGDKAVWVLQR